jgi:hypothetical protein
MIGYYIRRDGANDWSVWFSRFGCNSELIYAHLAYQRARSEARKRNRTPV